MECRLTSEVLARLAEPFPDEQVSWKPQAILKDKNTRAPKRDDKGYVTALAVPYIDARDVAERLDQVVGGDWSFTWHAIDAPSISKTTVVCGVLTVCGVTRSDAGEYKESDDMEAWKAAVSDALKRAAALFGVGRYLYRMEGDWCKYDDRRNRWAEQPRAKVQAPPPKPAAKPAAKRAPAPPAPKEGDGSHWIDDPDTRAKFWSWATGTDVAGANGTPELGLTKREVYDVLGVEHIHDYRGDVKQASHQLLAFAREHAHAIRERIARGERAERVAYASKKGGAA